MAQRKIPEDQGAQDGDLTQEQAQGLALLAESISSSEPSGAQGGAGGGGFGDPAKGESEFIGAGGDVDNLAGVIELLFLPAGGFGLERVAAIWTPQECRKVAERAVPVLQKSGWGRTLLAWCRDGFGVEEMALFAVLAPMVKRTVEAFRADVVDLRERRSHKAAQSARDDGRAAA